MQKQPRRRLRSASVQLGALTALALTLSGCDLSDDDDDCALGPTGGGGVVAVALAQPVASAGTATAGPDRTVAVPDRGGFGTHLASCGG